jgi:hypothetical protein
MTTHLGDDGYFLDDETEEAKELLPHAQVVILHGCGRTQLLQVICADPLCVECLKVRAARVRARWLPVLMEMDTPRMITLTMKSQTVLEQAKKDFQLSFRRLLDLRLDDRGLPKLVKAALALVHRSREKLIERFGEEVGSKYADALERSKIHDTEFWEKSVEKFRRTCEREAKREKFNLAGKHKGEVRKDQTIRFRDMIGPGFASYEVTYNPSEGWHFHRHCTVDGEFIPWPVLVVAWRIATKRTGSVVDIRLMDKSEKSMRELVKYCTKPWEIPDDKKSELRQSVRGLKRVWPLGGAKPVKAHPVCPFCKDENCRAHRVTGIVEIIAEGTLPSGIPYRDVWDAREEKSYTFTQEHGIWGGLADDPEAHPLLLILSAFACRSQAPPGETVRQETLDKVMADLFSSVPEVV